MASKNGQLNEMNYGTFKVIDDNGDPVTGLEEGDFSTIILYDPDGNDISGSTTNSLIELGNGMYKFGFFPISEGIHTVYIDHTSYLPTGISGEFEIHQDRAWLQRILGLVQENFYLDNTTYSGDNMTSARLRIYSNASSVGTTADIIGTYNLTAEFDSYAKLETYKLEKV